MHPLIRSYKKEFKENSDKGYAKGAQKYMKSEMPYYGVSSPKKKKIDSELKKKYKLESFDEWYSIIRELWDNAKFREERYAAMTVLSQYKEYHTLKIIPLIEHIIITGAWWDFIDGISPNTVGGLLKKYPKEMKKTLRSWNKSKHMWLRRSSILVQLKFKEETDPVLLGKFIERTMHEKEFFIRKAIGWALREYSKTNKKWVKGFISKNKGELSNLSVREGSKYI
jgi:3-methyladenine DNA glycosylase AlkD